MHDETRVIVSAAVATVGTIVLGIGSAFWVDHVIGPVLEGNAVLSFLSAAVLVFGPMACWFWIYRKTEEYLGG